jgi:hypothetical protein
MWKVDDQRSIINIRMLSAWTMVSSCCLIPHIPWRHTLSFRWGRRGPCFHCSLPSWHCWSAIVQHRWIRWCYGSWHGRSLRFRARLCTCSMTHSSYVYRTKWQYPPSAYWCHSSRCGNSLRDSCLHSYQIKLLPAALVQQLGTSYLTYIILLSNVSILPTY